MPKSPKTQRRSPRQARSRATCEAILEAASQILERQGPAGLNTNSVAERAGVSIGTLYQYFPDKQAILAAAARREFGAALRGRQRALALALIELVESLGRFGPGAASSLPRTAPAPAPRRNRRADSAWRTAADLLAELLVLIDRSPLPAPIPIRSRPR